MLQKIAAENNLSETAFLVPISSARYELKWFTPTVEMDLCGHATLASAFVLFSFIDTKSETIDFWSKSGQLTVKKSGKLLSMDFPSRPVVQIESPPILQEALNERPLSVFCSRDLMAVFKDELAIRNLEPNFQKLKEIHDYFGLIVTAPGDKVDFVSRFFAPNAGVDEDPVTGSAHCSLVPYWSEQLSKNRLHAWQLSSRGGELYCENKGDRVRIAGYSTLYAKGEIYI